MKTLPYLLILAFLFSCSTEPKPIEYGKDACSYCEMTIVSKAFSAQAVSDKGKQFKYDAIECMVNDLHDHSAEIATQRVADFLKPGTMILVEDALFIVNDSINSPMGANLAAIKIDSDLTSPQSADTFYWNDLINHLLQKDSIFTMQ